jgi:type VI protein secretion system component VasF
MTSEVSHYDLMQLQRAHAALEIQIQGLDSRLAQQAERSFARSCEMESRLTKWGVAVLAIAMAFTLFVAVITRLDHKPRNDAASTEPASTG